LYVVVGTGAKCATQNGADDTSDVLLENFERFVLALPDDAWPCKSLESMELSRIVARPGGCAVPCDGFHQSARVREQRVAHPHRRKAGRDRLDRLTVLLKQEQGIGQVAHSARKARSDVQTGSTDAGELPLRPRWDPRIRPLKSPGIADLQQAIARHGRNQI
jgi:hypothetical protein